MQWRGKGKEREALVRWLGFDRQTLRPWEDSWVKLLQLTADMRPSRKRGRAEVRRPEPSPPKVQKDGSTLKRSPRVAGDVAGPGMP